MTELTGMYRITVTGYGVSDEVELFELNEAEYLFAERLASRFDDIIVEEA